MKIAILSASPKDERSVTLQVGKLIEKFSEFSVKDEFTECLIGNGKYTKEVGEIVKQSDFIMFCTSLFHASVPKQVIGFLDAMEADIGKDIQGKPATLFTTCSQIMDVMAHGFMEERLTRMGYDYIRGLSLLDMDILSPQGREEVGNWYHYVRSYALHQTEKFKDNECQVVFLDATDGNNERLNKEMENARAKLTELGVNNIVDVKLREYDIQSCNACTLCYTTKECIHKDDFLKVCQMVYPKTSIILTFAELADGLLGTLHKGWLDRHVTFGLRPANEEIIKAYMIDESKSSTEARIRCEIHKTHIDNFSKNYFAGLCNVDNEEQKEKYYQDLVKIYNYELYPQRNFYSRGPDFMFKDIAWKIQKVAPHNYQYYKNQGNGFALEELNPNITGFTNYKEAIEASKNRLIPYKMMLASINSDESLQTRRRINNRWNKPETEMQVYKEGFFAKLLKIFKGKK